MTHDRGSALCPWLRANSFFSALSGAALIAFSGALPDLLGIGGRWVYVGIGSGLVVYAAHLWRVAGRPVDRPEITMIVVGDVVWVLGSLALVVSGALSLTGVWIVSGVALVIAVLAVGQWKGLKRTTSRPASVSP